MNKVLLKITTFIYILGDEVSSKLGLKRLLQSYFPWLYQIWVGFRWKSFINPGDTVVQAGVDMGTKHKVCRGSNVIHMSNAVGETGKVIAIEPTKDNVEKLREYIAQKNINNIIIVEKALWKEKGKLTFLIAKKSWDNQLAIIPDTDNIPSETWVNDYSVQADTLDNILHDIGVNEVNHICMTINGAELEALAGMTYTLKNKLSLYIASGTTQEYRSSVDGMPLNKKIENVLKSHGFKTKIDAKGWIRAHN